MPTTGCGRGDVYTTSYKPRAICRLSPFPRARLTPSAETRGPCSERRRELGRHQRANRMPQATGHKPPFPDFPSEARVVHISKEPLPWVTPELWLPSTDQPQATSYKLHAAFSLFPGRGRLGRPRSGAHAARTAKTLSLLSRSPRITRYGPLRHRHHALRTRRVDTRVRPHDEVKHITSHGPETTGRKPLLPPPLGEVAAGRRGVVCRGVGCGMWEVGGG